MIQCEELENGKEVIIMSGPINKQLNEIAALVKHSVILYKDMAAEAIQDGLEKAEKELRNE